MGETILERLQQRRIQFSPYQWASGSKNLFGIRDYEELCNYAWSDDVNTRIFINEYVIPEIVDILSLEQRGRLSDILRRQLPDKRMCEIGGSTSYFDNEDTRTVSGSAKAAIELLGERGKDVAVK